MKLKEAIEMVSEACYHYDGELYENCNYLEAFYVVLEELDNRIPRKVLEDKKEKMKKEIVILKTQKDSIKNGMKIILREGYIELLEEILNKE